jgi:osmotically-inducible protein OsmY
MTTASITGTDVRLRDTVIRQLDWDPEVDASAIGVGAAEGVVTLTGFIDSYTGKLAAERAVKHLRGVRAVANDLVVRPMAGRTDPDIAHDAAHVLKLTPALSDTVQATVHNGRVTLTGTVEWLLQKSQVEDAIHRVPGVVGVFNHLSVRPKPVGRDVHRRIVKALHCNADLDAQHISVSMANEVVTLTGTVGSWMQRDAAERAAAAAPGISRVDNQIVVVPPELAEFEPADEIC